MNNLDTIQDRIEQLIFIADDFLKLTEDLGDFYTENRAEIKRSSLILHSGELKTLVVHQKLYFSEALLILRTLFETSKQPRELSYELLLKQIQSKTQINLAYQEILKKYKKSALKEIRDQLFAHKDIRSTGDPANHYLNAINPDLVVRCREIVNDLLEFNRSYNPDSSSQNWIGVYEGLKDTTQVIKSDITTLLKS